jgi:hypothetical protein
MSSLPLSSDLCVFTEESFSAWSPPQVFENTRATEFAHDQVPRFGKPKDVLLFVIGSEDERKEYLLGLLSSSIAIFSLLLVWTSLLVYFQRAGPERYGWLSGRRVMPPNRKTEKATDDAGLELVENHNQDNNARRQEVPIDSGNRRMKGLPGPQLVEEGDRRDNKQQYDEELDVGNHQTHDGQTQREQHFMKALVAFAAFCIILSSIMMNVKG